MKRICFLWISVLCVSCQKSDSGPGGTTVTYLTTQQASVVLSSVGAVGKVASPSSSNKMAQATHLVFRSLSESVTPSQNPLVEKQSVELQKLIDQKQCAVQFTPPPNRFRNTPETQTEVGKIQSFRVEINGPNCPIYVLMALSGNANEETFDFGVEFNYKALTEEYRNRMDASEFSFRGGVKGFSKIENNLWLMTMDAQMMGQGISASQGNFSLSYSQKINSKMGMGQLNTTPPSSPVQSSDFDFSYSMAFLLVTNSGQLKLAADAQVSANARAQNFFINDQAVSFEKFLEALSGVNIPGTSTPVDMLSEKPSQTPQQQPTPVNMAAAAKIYPVVSQGRVQMNLQYGYDSEQDYFWSLSMTTNFTAQDYERWPNSMWWRIVDSVNGRIYKSWTSMDKENLMIMNLNMGSGARLKQFLPRIRSSRVEVSMDQSTATYVVDLGELCDRYAENVRDLTNPQNLTCTVYEYQLPGAPTQI